MIFDLFSPRIPHFSIEQPKFPTLFPIFPHFPPLSPTFPPFSLGSFHQCTRTPTIALLPIKTMFFLAFLEQNSPFFHPASKISHTFPHFLPFFLNQPISDNCTVTFQIRVFLKPENMVLDTPLRRRHKHKPEDVDFPASLLIVQPRNATARPTIASC